MKNELVSSQFHERPQEVVSQLGYGLCKIHSNRFWSNPVDAMREWHIALHNYEEVCGERDGRSINFDALTFQMARIFILRRDDTPRDIAYFSATVLRKVSRLMETFQNFGANIFMVF